MAWLTRFLAAVAFLAIGVIFSPETFGSKSDGLNSSKLSPFLKLAHLLCFSTAWGAALWVTFIGGIIMFKSVPFFVRKMIAIIEINCYCYIYFLISISEIIKKNKIEFVMCFGRK